MFRNVLPICIALSLVVGCGEDATPEEPASSTVNNGSNGKGDDPSQVCDDLGCETQDMGQDFDMSFTDVGTADFGAFDPDIVPADADLLFEYLSAGAYLVLEGQSEIKRDPTSFHGNSKVYFNDILVQSFEGGNTAHPAGSAAIKVMFDADDQMKGWVVGIKTGDSASSADWWWYENPTVETSNPTQAGSSGVCARCHGSGIDRVVTPYPFE